MNRTLELVFTLVNICQCGFIFCKITNLDIYTKKLLRIQGGLGGSDSPKEV